MASKKAKIVDVPVNDEKVERLIGLIEARLSEMCDEAEANMATHHEDWEVWLAQFKGTFMVEEAEGPFDDLYLPFAAKGAERTQAGLMKNLIPDRTGLDFFKGMAQASTDLELPEDLYSSVAMAQTAALRHDLIRCRYPSVRRQLALDECVLGNSFRLVYWEVESKERWERVPNPVYQLTDEQIAMWNADPAQSHYLSAAEIPQIGRVIASMPKDGGEYAEWTVLPAYEDKPTCVREYDAPKVRYLNPFNVFPTEMDRDGLEDCTGAFVYDACRFSELKEHQIQDDGAGGLTGIYRLTDDVEEMARENVPAVFHRNGSANTDRDDSPAPSKVKRLERHTYFGLFEDLPELCAEAGIEIGDASFVKFCRLFNTDPDRLAKRRAVVAEMVFKQKLIRFQASPFPDNEAFRNGIPIVHHRPIPLNNETIGLSPYSRMELPERIGNSFLRSDLEQAQMQAKPPVVMYDELLDPVFKQETGGITSLAPGMVIQAISPNSTKPPIESVKLPMEGREASQAAMAEMRRAVDELGGIPAVAAGAVGEAGVSARAVSVASAGADALLQELYDHAGEAEVRMLDKLAALHLQFDSQPRMVIVPGEDGVLASFQITPEVWQRRVVFFVTGPQTVANQNVDMQFWERFWAGLKESGRVNWEEVIKETARLLKRPMPGRFVAPPPGPEPVPARIAGSAHIDLSKEHPIIKEAVMRRLEIELPENAVDLMTQAAQVVTGLENGQALSETAPPPSPEGPGGPPPDGGMPMDLPFPEGDEPLVAQGVTATNLLRMENPPPDMEEFG